MMHINVITPGSPQKGSYSVVPNPDDPVIFQLQGNLIRVINVSASGITTLADQVTPGQRYRFLLDLPTNPTPVEGLLDTAKQAEKGQIYCNFVDLSPKEIDALHHYVLQRQKQAIRSLRRGTLT